MVEVIYGMQRGGVGDVRKAMENPPSYSAVRTTLNILVRKGILDRTKKGRKYLYSPTMPHEKASGLAIRRLLETYFNNSIEQAVTGLINADGAALTDQDYARLIALIRKAKNEERHK